MGENWKEAGLVLMRSAGQESNINLPNVLTLVRILLIPVFVMLLIDPTPDRALSAAIVFVVAAVTDLLDGYVARKTGQITKLGRLLDPIADKLLVLSALILLVQVDRVSALVAILIIAREVAVTGLRAIAASEGLIMSAEVTGKYKMALQVIAIVLLVLEGTVVETIGNLHLAGIVTLYLSLILGYVSGAQYVWSFWRQVGAKGL
ncbi:MAG: CDP-diacylglycerol--glycerol-3-phosphate 3-phosphatidyltransferase [Nitrospira sp.]|nr:CDP-diacylglycerol--glycerol-3-phosphate 3-phosphatidyltransferase [Nitrospira sp.]MBX3343240.1 CDP-diacylglycerol--glycerol-3-phosphate 3-phosphatidyltransferase [Nitrospira sp.]MBX3370780.1 CDP-diacylglycerol--glycerol-3-phosphate 3-phosphatidyltransferase [Nitrospira sp.]MBX7039314.1 CDP-diacylglycerol--glycerol-3-phosphate 3-phosphatidyltransferase [Nitrospira sp.]MCW5796491.1 CDP-diacylglycerol--glycerol-3-phosphate 3-phosphatidyltransferase [Nitrospira sp.]